MGELPMLYGLGSTSLQNQLAERSAEALSKISPILLVRNRPD
jgi:hypothetical protein